VTQDSDAVTTSKAARPVVPSPTMFWLPGTLMLWFGSWGVAEGGIGWAWGVWPVGLALLVVGAVAQGVAWGTDISKERHP
jgi:hypothetical protein